MGVRIRWINLARVIEMQINRDSYTRDRIIQFGLIKLIELYFRDIYILHLFFDDSVTLAFHFLLHFHLRESCPFPSIYVS